MSTPPHPSSPTPPQPDGAGPYPPAGQPYPQPGQPYPQPAQSSLQPGQPYPQPGGAGPYPPAGQPQAGPPQGPQAYPQPGQPYAAAQPAPKKKSRTGLWIGLGVGALVLLMMFGLASVLLNRGGGGGGGLFGPSPSDQAKQRVTDYYTALSEGRAADAVALIESSSIPDTSLLTDAVLADSLSRAPITDIVVGEPVSDGGSSFDVPVTYAVGGQETSDSLKVYVSSSTGPSMYSATSELGLYRLDGAPVTVNGVALTSASPDVFPGSYVVASSSAYLTLAGESTLTVLNSERVDPTLEMAVSDAGVQMFREKVIAAAEACLASTALDPGCGKAVPADVNGVQVRDNTVKRTMDAENRAKLANVTPEPGGSVPTVISAWDMGYFEVEAECNDGGSWGACSYTGDGTSFGTASIDVTDPNLTVQWDS